MTWTRREWMLAAGSIPLQLSAFAELAAQGRGGGRGNTAEALPPLGQAPTLPDKASFAHVSGTYLNSAASHPRPAGAIDLIKKSIDAESGANGFRPNETRIRQNFARLVNADVTEIALVPSTQIGESWVGAAIGLSPEKGSHVVSDHLHFTGSMQMYTDMAKRGLQVTWVKIKNNRIPLDDLDRAIIKGKTKLVAVSHTALVSGFQHDLARVSEIAHAKGAFVYADVIQAAGNVPLDLTAAGVDAACCATYKWLMSSGTAFLYVRKSSQENMEPPFYHFSRYTRLLPTTHIFPFDTPATTDLVDEYEVKPGAPGMFSTGYEPNIATLAGLEYSLPYIMNIGPGKIQVHAQTLTDRLKTELPKLGYEVMTPREARSPIVTIAVKDAQRLNPVLRAANVTVTTRWNHVRISPTVFNDMNDVERLLSVLPRAS